MITLMKYCAHFMFWMIACIILIVISFFVLLAFASLLDCYGVISYLPEDFWGWTDGWCV